MKFYYGKNGDYYDLIEVPHGHIPVPLLFRLWKYLPIPEGRQRDRKFYSCPECGRFSFFKIEKWCRNCDIDLECWYDENYEYDRRMKEKKYGEMVVHWQNREKKEIMRLKWKRLEHLILPILLLIGKIKYNKSKESPYRGSNRENNQFVLLSNQSTLDMFTEGENG